MTSILEYAVDVSFFFTDNRNVRRFPALSCEEEEQGKEIEEAEVVVVVGVIFVVLYC